MGIRQNIADNKYEPSFDFPDAPQSPATLPTYLRSGKESEEKAKYEAAMIRYRSERDRWRQERDRLQKVFLDDLCAEYKIPRNHPFGNKILSMAWEEGHANGYLEVVHHFTELLSLWDIAVSLGMNPTAERKKRAKS